MEWSSIEKSACGWIVTLRAVVEGCAPAVAGPRGRERWRNPSASVMLGDEIDGGFSD